MNLEQLRYVCAIYETGSISRAADKLFLSQPNVSNAVSRLEKELGFPILLRSHNGVQFTERGLELVQYASRILEECSTIRKMRTQPALQNFRVVSPHYPPVDKAFINLYGELEEAEKLSEMNLRLSCGNWMEGLKALHKKDAELVVTCIPVETTSSASFLSSIQQHGIAFFPITETSVVAKLSKDHPLLQEEPFPFAKLNDYPMTEYYSQVDSLSAYGGIRLPFNFNPRRVYVDSGRTRSQLIARTKAWGIAVKLPKRHEEEYGIRYVEIPDSVWSIGYLKDAARPMTDLDRRFLELLREELEFLDD